MNCLIFLITLVLISGTSFSNSWQVFTPENSELESKVISEIIVDEGNITWIGTGSGLAKFENSKLTLLNNTNSTLLSEQITDIFLDKDNLIWVLYNKKIYRGINSNFELYRDDIGGNEIVVNSKGTVYIGNNKYLIQLSDNNKLDTIFEPDDNEKAPISDLVVDKYDNIWISTYSNFDDFWKFEADTITHYNSSIINQEMGVITSIKTDISGDVWIIGGKSMLLKYDIEKETWNDMKVQYSLNLNTFTFVNAIAFDKNNNLNFVTSFKNSTPSKLYSFNGNNFEVSNFDSLYPADMFVKLQRKMALDYNNKIYIGAVDLGIFRYEANTATVNTMEQIVIKLFPNPASNQLTIDLQGKQATSYTISDIKGNIVENNNGNYSGQMDINLKSYPTGTYIIELTLMNNQKITNKFVKE